jgi:transcriptional regulator with XRE-family HTH domain
MPENTKLGSLLARIRGERGLTQESLAKASGLSRTQIARIETGVQGKGDISLRAASGLANAIGVTVGQFMAMVDAEEVADATVPRRPGRPAKALPENESAESDEKRERGRPRKPAPEAVTGPAQATEAKAGGKGKLGKNGPR